MRYRFYGNSSHIGTSTADDIYLFKGISSVSTTFIIIIINFEREAKETFVKLRLFAAAITQVRTGTNFESKQT